MLEVFFKKHINKNKLTKNIVYKLLFFIFCSIVLLPYFSNSRAINNIILLGLDPSWLIALQYAYEQNLTFGKDIIFTYGPLGYLKLNENLLIPKINFVLFGIFQLIYLLFGCNLIYNKFKENNFFVWIVILMSTLITSIPLKQPIIFIAFLSFIFLLQSIQSHNLKYLILSYIGALTCFYIKIDTGFSLLLAVSAGIILFTTKTKNKTLNIKLLIFFILTFVSSFLILNVNIVGYVVGGYHLIKGYNEAMFVLLKGKDIYVFEVLIYGYVLFAITILLLVVFYIYQNKLNFSKLLQIAILVGLSFIFYKKGITRISSGSLQYATRGIALVSLLFSIFIVEKKWMKYIFLFQFFILSLIIPKRNCIDNFKSILTLNKKEFYNIDNKFKFKKYISNDSIVTAFSNLENKIGIDSLSNMNFDKVDTNQLELNFLNKVETSVKRNNNIHSFTKKFNENRHLVQRLYIPNRIRKKLKGKTVDIYDTNIHFAYYNNLNYKPRPLLQSYAAYNEFLDKKNVPLVSANNEFAVDYIIWDCFHGTDRRYKFWETPITMKTILENYEYDDVIYPKNVEWKLLLKKLDQPKKVFSNTIYTIDSFSLNKLYNIPKVNNQLLTAKIKVDETLLHKIAKIVSQTKTLRIELHLEDGTIIKKHKIVRNILNNGIIINKYIQENSRYEETQFFKHNFQSLKNLKAIKLLGDPKYFKTKINIEISN